MVGVEEIVSRLRSLRNEKNIGGMARFGITFKAEVLGVPKPVLRRMAREIGRDTELALELWETNIHEARILATMIADPEEFGEEHARKRVGDVDNWDLSDQLAMNLLWRTSYARELAEEFCRSDREYTARVEYVVIATIVRKTDNPDEELLLKFQN